MDLRKYCNVDNILFGFIMTVTAVLLIVIFVLFAKIIFAKEYEGVLKEKIETGETKCTLIPVQTYPAISRIVCKDVRYFVIDQGDFTDTVSVCSKSKFENFSVGDTLNYKLRGKFW